MINIENSDLYIVSESEINFVHVNGSHARSACPACRDKREHPNDPSVAWDRSAGVGYCHHCNARFKIDKNPRSFCTAGHSDYKREDNADRRTDKERSDDYKKHLMPLEQLSLQYLKDRGISLDTAMRAGVCSHQVWRGTSWFTYVAFPFFEGENVVNVQYKGADLDHKSFFMERGGRLIPWNVRCLYEDNGWEPLYITEGMMDALALMECGCSYVVSVPNGAECNMECFARYHALIKKKFSCVVFAGDTDEQGLKLRARVQKFFDDMDVVCVDWDKDEMHAKDADEMLMNYGRDVVNVVLHNAEVAGFDNLYISGVTDSGIEELFKSGIPQGKGIGLEGFDDIVHFEPGNLLLVTGYPGSGKSTLVNFIVARMMKMYQWKTLFFSPEKMPMKYHEAEIVSILAGANFNGGMTGGDFREALKMMRCNLYFIDEQVGEVDDIVRIARRAVRVFKVGVIVIDPFVYLSMPAIPGASETQKIAVMLKKLMLVTRELEVITILVAHPRKPSSDGPSEPSLYEVAGSANFYNFCDAGIIMERLKSGSNLVRVTCGKARRAFNGALGVCQLAYDASCGRYVPCIKKGDTYTTEYGAFDHTPWFLEKEKPYGEF